MFLGDMNMLKWRPSSLGGLSTTAMSAHSLANLVSSFFADLGGVPSSLPRKRTATLSLSPSERNFCPLLSLTLEIVQPDTGRHADLLDFDHVLIFARLFLALGLLKRNLAVIHDTAIRRGERSPGRS